MTTNFFVWLLLNKEASYNRDFQWTNSGFDRDLKITVNVGNFFRCMSFPLFLLQCAYQSGLQTRYDGKMDPPSAHSILHLTLLHFALLIYSLELFVYFAARSWLSFVNNEQTALSRKEIRTIDCSFFITQSIALHPTKVNQLLHRNLFLAWTT